MHADQSDYGRFCTWPMIEKAVRTLVGILDGITADGVVNQKEFELVANWLDAYSQFTDRHPFNEIIPRVLPILEDQKLSPDERDDLLWLGTKIIDGELMISAKHEMQELHGILQGIIADGVASIEELDHLQSWLDNHEDLRTLWPYDELQAMLAIILQDRKVDEGEHAVILEFLAQFCEYRTDRSLYEVQKSNLGVCALQPHITFDGKKFCFTGSSKKMTRKQVEAKIIELGGIAKSGVTRDLDYLVVGSEGNPCWAYACYGRKVEDAMKLRQSGHGLVIVHENDFWDAVEDTQT